MSLEKIQGNRTATSTPNANAPSKNIPLNSKFQYYKTKWCPFYFMGKCMKGKDCRFAHSKEEFVLISQLQKTKICNLYAKGICPAKQDCSYAHGAHELRPKPQLHKTVLCVPYQQTGHCKFGKKMQVCPWGA